MIIKTIQGKSPKIPNDCYIAENATIIGEVEFGSECSIWFNAVVRGDVNYIKIGNKVNIQDGAIVHATYQNIQQILAIMFLLGIMQLFTDVP